MNYQNRRSKELKREEPNSTNPDKSKINFWKLNKSTQKVIKRKEKLENILHSFTGLEDKIEYIATENKKQTKTSDWRITNKSNESINC